MIGRTLHVYGDSEDDSDDEQSENSDLSSSDNEDANAAFNDSDNESSDAESSDDEKPNYINHLDHKQFLYPDLSLNTANTSAFFQPSLEEKFNESFAQNKANFMVCYLEKNPCCYTTLGVSKTASEDEIKNAYAERANVYHQIKNPMDKRNAAHQFYKLVDARDILLNVELRGLYDEAMNNQLSEELANRPSLRIFSNGIFKA